MEAVRRLGKVECAYSGLTLDHWTIWWHYLTLPQATKTHYTTPDLGTMPRLWLLWYSSAVVQ